MPSLENKFLEAKYGHQAPIKTLFFSESKNFHQVLVKKAFLFFSQWFVQNFWLIFELVASVLSHHFSVSNSDKKSWLKKRQAFSAFLFLCLG